MTWDPDLYLKYRGKHRLSPARYGESYGVYRRRVGAALGVGEPYLYTFERLLMWARR